MFCAHDGAMIEVTLNMKENASKDTKVRTKVTRVTKVINNSY